MSIHANHDRHPTRPQRILSQLSPLVNGNQSGLDNLLRSFRLDNLKVCMLLSNDMLNDPRVTRHAETLGKHGCKVTVVCRLSDRTQREESHAYYKVIRVRSKWEEIQNRRSRSSANPSPLSDTRLIPETTHKLSKESFGTMISLVTNIGLFQFPLAVAARRVRAHVYCANDFDTLFAAVLAAGLDSELLYDSHELWPDMLLGVPPFFKRMVSSLEGILIKRANAVVTVNEFIAGVLAKRHSIKTPDYVYNCPSTIARSVVFARRRRIKRVLYQGVYVPERGLENIVKSADHLEPDVEVIFRGYGAMEPILQRLSVGKKNITFKRPVAMQNLVEAAFEDADVGIISYLPTNLCNYLASPNKLFDYIQAGLPVVASDTPFMRRIVQSHEIGALFDPRSPESIAKAINMVTRPSTLRRCKKNVKRIGKKFSWQNEQVKLLRIYDDLRTRVLLRPRS